MYRENNSSYYKVDEFLANADYMDIIHIFWKFRAKIENNKVIRDRISQKSDGKIPVLDMELFEIAKELKKIAQEDITTCKKIDEIEKRDQNARLEKEKVN